MKILHLSHTDIRSDSRILKEMTALLSLGNEPKIYGIGIRDLNSRTIEKNPNLEIECIDLVFKKFNFFFRHLRFLLIYFELFIKMLSSSISKKPNVVHCHDVVVLPIALFVKMFTGAKLIYDAHELESQKNGTGRLESKLTLLVEKIAWKTINAFIVVSPPIEKWYVEHIGKKKAEVILNAPIVSPTLETQSHQYLRNHFNIPENQKVFLYVGLLARGRGIDLLLKVFERNEVTSHLVFLGYGELYDSLVEASRKNPKIHVHAAVSHDRVTDIASSADVGLCLIQNVSLSDYYSLPNKLFEYSFAGIKILASDFPEISRVVKKYNLGECVDLDEVSIFNAVVRLEKETGNTKSINKEIYNELSWKAQEIKLLKLYKSL